MSLRFGDATKWFWILVIYASQNWIPVRCVSVKTPPKNPSTIEAQAKFFQDFFSVQLSPHNIEFGHVCEDPETWEQRYEKKDFKNHRDMGKVRWGDKKGGYGEHYWDLNHAGHNNDHDGGGYEGDSDDGSYREEYKNDAYEEPSQYSPTYDDGYDPEKAAKAEDINRAKRAQPRNKVDKKRIYKTYEDEDVNERTPTKNKARGEPLKSDKQNDQNLYRKTVTAKHQNNYESDESEDDSEEYEPNSEEDEKERKQVVLVLSQKDKGDNEENSQSQNQYNLKNIQGKNTQNVQQFPVQSNQNTQQFVPHDNQQFAPTSSQQFGNLNTQQYSQNAQNSPGHFPYESETGVKSHQLPEASASTALPRLFLEPSTGHIIDRATGRAYVLQPLEANYE